jgi:hypothetical protein
MDTFSSACMPLGSLEPSNAPVVAEAADRTLRDVLAVSRNPGTGPMPMGLGDLPPAQRAWRGRRSRGLIRASGKSASALRTRKRPGGRIELMP